MSPARSKTKARLMEVVTPHKPVNVQLTDLDLEDQLRGEKASSLFLGQFELERIQGALERFGITEQLHKLGYAEVEIEFHARSAFEHFLRIFSREQHDKVLLGEIILKEGHYTPRAPALPDFTLPPLDVLSIEWILMQHVRGQFTPKHRRLPGQNHPGLGLGHKVVDLLLWVTHLMEKEALINMPEYFHNALFYDRWFKFYDPRVQGTMQAVIRDLAAAGYDLADMSYAAYFNCLLNRKTGERFCWQPQEQLLAMSEPARQYLEHPDYARLVRETSEALSFTVDGALFMEKIAKADHLEW